MQFNGANIAERFEASANGPRVRFTRDIGNITMDLDGVERVNVNALGGADTLTVDDLSGTDVTEVNTDLAATGGGRRRCGRQRDRQRHERRRRDPGRRRRRRHRPCSGSRLG